MANSRIKSSCLCSITRDHSPPLPAPPHPPLHRYTADLYRSNAIELKKNVYPPATHSRVPSLHPSPTHAPGSCPVGRRNYLIIPFLSRHLTFTAYEVGPPGSIMESEEGSQSPHELQTRSLRRRVRGHRTCTGHAHSPSQTVQAGGSHNIHQRSSSNHENGI